MKKILVPVTVVTFIHKDTKETFFVVGDDNITSNSFEDTIFGEYYNCTGLWKAMSHAEKLGHTVLTEKTSAEVMIPA